MPIVRGVSRGDITRALRQPQRYAGEKQGRKVTDWQADALVVCLNSLGFKKGE